MNGKGFGGKFYAGYSQIARYPSFTELYYSDPFTQGSTGLKPERNLECRAGLNMDVGAVEFSADGMLRYSDGLDWRQGKRFDLKWTIANRGKIRHGIADLSAKTAPFNFNLSVGHIHGFVFARPTFPNGAITLKTSFLPLLIFSFTA